MPNHVNSNNSDITINQSTLISPPSYTVFIFKDTEDDLLDDTISQDDDSGTGFREMSVFDCS